MKDLDYTLKSEIKRQKEESQRFERLEQFKGIRKQERETVLELLFKKAVAKHKRYAKGLNKYIIFQDDLKEIIEELKGE